MKRLLCIILVCLITTPAFALDDRFISVFSIRIGGDSITTGQVDELAKFDLILVNKFHYNDADEGETNTWINIKNHDANDGPLIFVYEIPHNIVETNDCAVSQQGYTDIARYDHACDVASGEILSDHELGDASPWYASYNSAVVEQGTVSDRYLLDFSNSTVIDYVKEALWRDVDGKAWGVSLDGIYSDHCFPVLNDSNIGNHLFEDDGTPLPEDTGPAEFSTNSAWNTAMNTFLSAVTAYLNSKGYMFAGNRGYTRDADGKQGWEDLDDVASPPDYVLEEAVFATGYGSGDVQFFPPAAWLLQIQTLSGVENSYVLAFVSTDLANEADSGTDNYSKSVTGADVFWYGICSFALTKKTGDMFAMNFTTGSYNTVFYNEFPEYEYMNPGENLHLGNALGSYTTDTSSGVTVYYREFQNGYVFVNPQTSDATGITLPEPCKVLNHSNYSDDLNTISTVSSMNLVSHRGVILYKESALGRNRGITATGVQF